MSDPSVSWDRYVHPDDLPSAAQVWAAALRSGDWYYIEFRVRGADERFVWFLVRAEPIRDQTGAIVRWFGTCTDIEDRKRDEEVRAKLLDAERAARVEADRASRMETSSWRR